MRLLALLVVLLIQGWAFGQSSYRVAFAGAGGTYHTSEEAERNADAAAWGGVHALNQSGPGVYMAFIGRGFCRMAVNGQQVTLIAQTHPMGTQLQFEGTLGNPADPVYLKPVKWNFRDVSVIQTVMGYWGPVQIPVTVQLPTMDRHPVLIDWSVLPVVPN